MSEREIGIISTKLDILIEDFQRSREAQENINRILEKHMKEEEKLQARLINTNKWQNIIGAGIIGCMVWFYTDIYLVDKERIEYRIMKCSEYP